VSASGGHERMMFDPSRDIAVRKGVEEEELRKSRDQLEIILRGVADGITAQDHSGHLIYANDAAVRTLGYPSVAALLATPVAEVMQQFELLDEMGRPLSLERLYGYSAVEMIGQPSLRLVPPERTDEMYRILERLQRGERVDHFETVRLRKDGRRLDVSVSVAPLTDAAGRIVGASAIARDITE